jgi:ribosomal protein S27AE
MFQWLLVALLYICTVGIAYLLKKGVRRHCPQCGHIMSNHQRRDDGSFRD